MQSFFVFGGGGTRAKFKRKLCVGLGGFVDLSGFFYKGLVSKIIHF